MVTEYIKVLSIANSAAKIGKNIEAQMKMRKMMKKMHFSPKSDKLWNKNIIFAENNFSEI